LGKRLRRDGVHTEREDEAPTGWAVAPLATVLHLGRNERNDQAGRQRPRREVDVGQQAVKHMQRLQRSRREEQIGSGEGRNRERSHNDPEIWSKPRRATKSENDCRREERIQAKTERPSGEPEVQQPDGGRGQQRSEQRERLGRHNEEQ